MRELIENLDLHLTEGAKWERRKVKIKLKGGKPYSPSADVMGSWAVHLDREPDPDDETQPGYAITFLPTSQRLSWRAGKTDAKKLLLKVLKAVPEVRDAGSMDDLKPHLDRVVDALKSAG